MTKGFYMEAVELFAQRAMDSIDYLTGFSVTEIRKTVNDAIGKIDGVLYVAGYEPDVKWADFRELEHYAEKKKETLRFMEVEKTYESLQDSGDLS